MMIKFIRKYKWCKRMGINHPIKAELDKNFMDYLCYLNEKYYRNGFVDGVQMIMGCVEE